MGIVKYLAGVFLLIACISAAFGDKPNRIQINPARGPSGKYNYRYHRVRDQIRVCSFEVEGVRYQIVWFNGKSTTFKIGD